MDDDSAAWPPVEDVTPVDVPVEVPVEVLVDAPALAGLDDEVVELPDVVALELLVPGALVVALDVVPAGWFEPPGLMDDVLPEFSAKEPMAS